MPYCICGYSAFQLQIIRQEEATDMLTRTGVLLLVVAILLSVLCAHATEKQIRLRINTSHGLQNAKGAVMDAGLRLTTDVSVTPSSISDGHPFLPPDKFLEDGLRVGATILSSSFSGWNYLMDSAGYLKLCGNGMVHVYAYEPRQQQQKNAPPPAVFVTVNAVGRTTGDGIEFGVPTNYMEGKGQSPYPSGVTAQLAGLVACLKYRHSTWNWFDVKAALRSTAANFKSGYDPRTYGFGVIDYHSANALSGAPSLPLFPPAAVVLEVQNDRVVFSVNSFKQTRRTTDALFKFTTSPQPQLRDLALNDITSLKGEPVFVGDPSVTTNSVSYQTAHDETVCFVWFTKDANGMFSRIEPYSIIGPVTLHKPYGPRLNRRPNFERR